MQNFHCNFAKKRIDFADLQYIITLLQKTKEGGEKLNGKNITVIRKAKGITQEELSHALQINIATLSRWENGHFEPKTSMLRKLCEILQVSESELLNGPVSENWELKVLMKKEGVIDMTSKKSSAVLNIGEDAMAITLSAGYELWEDDAKFEELIEQLRKKRKVGLKTRKEEW